MDKILHLWVAKIRETTKKSDCNYWKRLKAKIGFDDLYKILAPWVVKIHFPDGSMDGGVGAEKAIIRSKSTKDPVLTIERDNVLLVKTNEIERLCSQNQCEINIHKQMSREKNLNLKFLLSCKYRH